MPRIFSQPVAPSLGIDAQAWDVRAIARASFSRGQVGEFDFRNLQSVNLTVGRRNSGLATLIPPTVLGSRGAAPQAVALTDHAVNIPAYARVQGIVLLKASGTVAPGDILTIDDMTAGRRVYGFALEANANGYFRAVWDGVYGFGTIVVVGGANQPPDAALTALPSSGIKPLSVLLDASGSADPDGFITKYEFDYGEGGGWVDNGTDPDITHVYSTQGVYDAAVRVTDDGTPGLQDIATVRITVTKPDGGIDPGEGGATDEPGDGDLPAIGIGVIITQH